MDAAMERVRRIWLHLDGKSGGMDTRKGWVMREEVTNEGGETKTQQKLQPFHLAFPVTDLAKARKFYGEVLGCEEGRSSTRWVDYNLYGNQIVCHLAEDYVARDYHNPVDKDDVPVPHFGIALTVQDFHALVSRLRSYGVKFIIEPHERFQGQPGQQWTMFFKDPFNNSLEFKAMVHPENLFAKYFVNEH